MEGKLSELTHDQLLIGISIGSAGEYSVENDESYPDLCPPQHFWGPNTTELWHRSFYQVLNMEVSKAGNPPSTETC